MECNYAIASLYQTNTDTSVYARGEKYINVAWKKNDQFVSYRLGHPFH